MQLTKLKAWAKRLKDELPVLFLALRHPATPWYAKALAAITVAYALSPIDLIPDFIPVLGYLDDMLLLPVLCAATLKLIPAAVMDECRNNRKPPVLRKRWWFALPTIILYALVILWIVRIWVQ